MPDDTYKSNDAEKEWYKLYFEYELKRSKKDRFSITQMLDTVADEFDPTRLLLKKDILYGTLSSYY